MRRKSDTEVTISHLTPGNSATYLKDQSDKKKKKKERKKMQHDRHQEYLKGEQLLEEKIFQGDFISICVCVCVSFLSQLKVMEKFEKQKKEG